MTTHAPCVIFVDEIDAMGRARRDSDESCVYSFKCELLRHMDGLEGHRVVVLACTNCVHALDPALRRRFQRVLYLGPPDEEGRLAILNTLASDTSDAAVLEEVAKRTPRATGADLATLFQRASVLRMDARTLDRAVRRARDGSDLARRLGPIALDHWRAAAQQSGVWRERA
jgi:cell division protease FtsH